MTNRDNHSHETAHWKFDPDDCTPELDVVEAVAELENKDPEVLSPLYSTIGDTISDIFSDPPSPKAQMEIMFSYEGYRITIHQDGKAEFVEVT